MTEQARVLVFEFFLSVGVAWFVYSCLYKRVRLDAFRETLFTIRDDLFDYMWQHRLSYEEPAYGLLRSSLNGMIRAADEGSFNLLIVISTIRAHFDPRVPSRVSAAIAAVRDPETRQHFEEVQKRIAGLAFRHIWLEGPLSFVILPAVMIYKLAVAWRQYGGEFKVEVKRAHLLEQMKRVKRLQQLEQERELVEAGVDLDPSRERARLVAAG